MERHVEPELAQVERFASAGCANGVMESTCLQGLRRRPGEGIEIHDRVKGQAAEDQDTVAGMQSRLVPHRSM
jgi:hypothetical protein